MKETIFNLLIGAFIGYMISDWVEKKIPQITQLKIEKILPQQTKPVSGYGSFQTRRRTKPLYS